MILTESDARKRMCPMIAGSLCAASSCMAWRWYDDEESGEVVVPASETGGDPIMRWTPRGTARRGYCGLAGEPQQ